MKTLARLALIASLALGANVASAIPLRVNVSTLAAGGSAGSWSLVGTTPGSGSWTHLFVNSQNWDLDIAPGAYDWSISGAGLAIVGAVGWSLHLDGQQIYSDNASGLFRFRFADDHSFTAERVSVPEPATLTLLGLGLGLLGFGMRGKRRASV
jgi:hypothetical protein